MKPGIAYTFSKGMRLSSKKAIDSLFLEGNTFVSGPFRVFYRLHKPEHPDVSLCRIAFSVSKKRLKSAVHRNLIKRRLRESFRLQYPHLLKPALEQSVRHFCYYAYLPHEIKPWNYTKRKMEVLLSYFADLCQKVLSLPLILLVKCYRLCISPFTPASCRFTPPARPTP